MDSRVSAEYRGMGINHFLDSKIEEGYSQGCLLDTVDALHSAGVHAPPHLVDALYNSFMNSDYPDVLVFFGSGRENEFTLQEMSMISNAFNRSYSFRRENEGPPLRIDILPGIPLSRTRKAMQDSLSGVYLDLNSRGFRPVVDFSPLFQDFHPGQVHEDVFRMLEEHRAILVASTGLSREGPVVLPDGTPDVDAADPLLLLKVAGNYPKLDIVLSGFGSPDSLANAYWRERGAEIKHFEHAFFLIDEFPNVYADISGNLHKVATPSRYSEATGKDRESGEVFYRSRWALEKLRENIDRSTRARGFLKIRNKLVYGSGYPVTTSSELKKHIRILGEKTNPFGSNPITPAYRTLRLLRKK